MKAASTSLLALALFTGVADAHTPPRAEAFSAGVELSGDTAPARGVVLLRAAPSGRVWLTESTFTMGSTELEVGAAMRLCWVEPLGRVELRGEPLCDRDVMPQIELPPHPVTLSGFAIDVTEVRVADYDRCIAAGACPEPAFRRGDRRYDRPEFPVTAVSVDAASRYCAWAGGKLPTEAQWELAARGIEGRTFPWGDVYNPHLANHGSLGVDPTDATDGFVGLAPVGSFPDGKTPSGLFDMAGNVQEWVLDTALDPPPRNAPPGSPDTIARYPATSQSNPLHTGGQGHFVRGGSYRTGAHKLRTASREPTTTTLSDDIGFRCVYEHP